MVRNSGQCADAPTLRAVLLIALLSVLGQSRVTLVFGGDVIPHEPVKRAASLNQHTADIDGERVGVSQGGWGHVFGPLTGVLQAADLSEVNLETPITTLTTPERGDMVFNAAPDLLAGLKRAGVDVASFANNHCLDQHREGIVSTRAHLADAGLLSVGAAGSEAEAWQPLVMERAGFRIGLLAVTRWLNGFSNLKDPKQPHVPMVQYPEDEPVMGSHTVDQLISAVAEAAKTVEVLVVIIHWGDEYSPRPRTADRLLARSLISAGATLIIGHHPHVLQPVELITRDDGSRGLVAFSLGNLVSNQDAAAPDGTKRDGLLLGVTLERAPDAGVNIVRLTPAAVFTENRLPSENHPRNVQAVLLDDELFAMEERVVELAGRRDEKSRAEKRVLLERRALAATRRARILSLMPELVSGSRETRQVLPTPVRIRQIPR